MKFKCPYCYEEHDINKCDIRCSKFTNSINAVDECPKGCKAAGPSGEVLTENKKACLKCGESRQISVVCPKTLQIVPKSYVQKSVNFLPIALLGAKATGKSNYIGMLVHELKKGNVAEAFQWSLGESSDNTLMLYNKTYGDQLFKNKKPVAGTNTRADKKPDPPLLYTLNLYRTHKNIGLTLYDTAGENFNTETDIIERTGYIFNASGIILLLDPLQLTAIRRKLAGKIILPQQNSDTGEILNRIIRQTQSVGNVHGKIKIPLAMAITKIDVLEKFGLLDGGDLEVLKEESLHVQCGRFSISDFESVNHGIQALLQEWVDDDLLQKVRQFETYAFFGLTALGNIPKRVNNSVDPEILGGELAPKRVLDPLLWILYQNKYLKKAKE